MKRILTVLVLLTTGCAGSGESLYRDASGAGRGQDALEQDVAQCQYEYAQARAGSGQYVVPGQPLATAVLSTPSPELYRLCMRARGWEKVAH